MPGYSHTSYAHACGNAGGRVWVVLEEHPTSWDCARAARGGSVRVVLEGHPTIDFLALSEPQKMEHLLEVLYISLTLFMLCQHVSIRQHLSQVSFCLSLCVYVCTY
jgi:hypothetical protein